MAGAWPEDVTEGFQACDGNKSPSLEVCNSMAGLNDEQFIGCSKQGLSSKLLKSCISVARYRIPSKGRAWNGRLIFALGWMRYAFSPESGSILSSRIRNRSRSGKYIFPFSPSIFPDPSVIILVKGALQRCLRKTRGVHVSPAGHGIINDDINKTFSDSFEK